MGIYKITNNVDGKIYVGSSHNITIRWNTHQRELKFNNHDNKYMQSAWNKYGQEGFKFEIVEKVEHEENLLDIEQRWLDDTQCYNPEIGYNLSCLTRGSNVKYNILRQNIINNIIKEDIPLYYDENTGENLYTKDNRILPMVNSLNGLIKKLYALYNSEVKMNNSVYLSNCLIYSQTINFNLKNIVESKSSIDNLLANHNIEMIRIEDYCHSSNSLNIYKNTFAWFKIENNKLILQSHFRNDEIYLTKLL